MYVYWGAHWDCHAAVAGVSAETLGLNASRSKEFVLHHLLLTHEHKELHMALQSLLRRDERRIYVPSLRALFSWNVLETAFRERMPRSAATTPTTPTPLRDLAKSIVSSYVVFAKSLGKKVEDLKVGANIIDALNYRNLTKFLDKFQDSRISYQPRDQATMRR